MLLLKLGTATVQRLRLSSRWLSRPLAVPPEGQEGRTDVQVPRLSSGKLRRLAKEFRARPSVRNAAQEYGIEGLMFARTLQSFAAMLTVAKLKQRPELLETVENVLSGGGHLDDLFPHYISHVRQHFPAIFTMPELKRISDLSNPASWYPAARAMPKRKLIYHAGPTNSGKTHHALQHFLGANRAIYCAPLRMLAHEIYQRANKQGVACDLLTGKEKLWASGSASQPASHLACTVEMSALEVTEPFDVAVVDEMQMLTDATRGGAWTRAILGEEEELGLPARELHLCGHECAAGLVRRMVESVGETVEVKHYDRLAPLYPLEHSLGGCYNRVQPGDCVVVFKRSKVFEVRECIQQATKQRCAVIYGGLPPATLFNNGASGYNVLVATDAIGMGLNLNIRRVIFHGLVKYDGQRHENLSSGHTKQIAGRAGRYGLTHPEGEVTTFYQKDLSLLHELLEKPEEETQQAGIYPTVEQIKLFSEHLPGSSLSDILNMFFRLARLDGNYFLCDSERLLRNASLLEKYPMPLPDLFTFCISPVDIKNPATTRVLPKFAHAFSADQEITIGWLRKILHWPLPRPLNPHHLQNYEDTHEVIDLYLWFSMRFPEVFSAGEEARNLQKKLQSTIDHSLTLWSRQKKKSVKKTTRKRHKASEVAKHD